jgi:broad-specificity NMP kinase
MAKLIEIVGPPGSGKTFLSSRLQSLKINKIKFSSTAVVIKI